MRYSPLLERKARSRAWPMFVFAAINLNPFSSQRRWRNSREPSVDRPSTMRTSSSPLRFASRDEAHRRMGFAEFRFEIHREYVLIYNLRTWFRDPWRV